MTQVWYEHCICFLSCIFCLGFYRDLVVVTTHLVMTSFITHCDDETIAVPQVEAEGASYLIIHKSSDKIILA